MRKKTIFFILAQIFFFIFAFSVGFYFGKIKYQFSPIPELDFKLLTEAYQKLKENFIDETKFTKERITYGAISGIVRSLEDPHTLFLTPQQAKIFEQDIKGVFEGIGIEIGIKKGEVVIIAPLEGSPAQKAGLKSKDKILKVNDRSVSDMTFEEIISSIRGPKGTKVKLTILRENWKEPKDFEITRDVIEVPSLKWELKDDIVYLKIYHFSEKSLFDFNKAASQILKTHSKKMILDLRDNPGGYFEIANEISSWFVKEGKIVAIEEEKDGNKKEYLSSGPSLFSDYKIVILINGGSASGAEILAAALKENLGAILVGEKTFGKGSVQTLKSLSDGSALKITTARWLTPSGKVISEVGLNPDFEVKMPPEEIEERDLQLEKAIEILKK
jgi:carboxyl-terminal processing protease